MKIGTRVYKALQTEFPDQSDCQIGTVVGLSHSTVSYLRRGDGIGMKAAKWLSNHDSKWNDLYADVKAANKKSMAGRLRKRAITVGTPTSINLGHLPDNLKFWCGYIG